METGRLGKNMDNLISREEFDEFSQKQETKCLTLERELLSKIDENLETTKQTLKNFESKGDTGSDNYRPEFLQTEEVLTMIKNELKGLGVSEIPKIPEIPTPDDVLIIVQSEIQKIWPIVDEIIVNAAIETKEKGMP